MYGIGLETGFVNEANIFTIETRGAGTGGIGLSIEGPGDVTMTFKDKKDGSGIVSYIPDEEGTYIIEVTFNEKEIANLSELFADDPVNLEMIIKIIHLNQNEKSGKPAVEHSLEKTRIKMDPEKAKIIEDPVVADIPIPGKAYFVLSLEKANIVVIPEKVVATKDPMAT